MSWFVPVPAALILAVAAAGCGGSSANRTTTRAAQPTTTKPRATTVSAPTSPGALQAEANAAAAGDIPDNQIFLAFQSSHAGYSIKYPEGWAQQGSGRTVVFRDKNNLVRIVVARGKVPNAGSVRDALAHLGGVKVQVAPQPVGLPTGRAVRVVYSTVSAPNAVTGKRVTLIVDRYYLSRAGRTAVIDLGTPQGVDNVDAYRLMIESFRWR
jgi:PsbP